MSVLTFPSSSQKHPSDRIHYLDNVRALAMLLGLIFHGGLTYAYPSNAIWIVADWEGDRVIDGLVWLLHIFRMATFFLIAGYFGKLLVERRGTGGFLWNRFVRIVCPFFLFYPFLLVAYVIAVMIAYAPTTLPPIMAANKAGPPPEQSLNTMHMWFLYYLTIFSVIAALLARFKIVVWDRVADWFYRSFWPTLFVPVVIVPALWFAGAPTGSTESFIPLPWVFGYYGFFFAAGWKLWGRESYLDIVGRYVGILIPISAILFAAYYYMMPNLSSVRSNPESLTAVPLERQLAMAFLSAYLSVFLTLTSLVLGKKFLSGHSHILKYISDASYWIYLVHLPLMLAIQGLMAPYHWNVWVKFASSVTVTFIVSLGLYAIFVRYTPLGWLLNGYKPFPWHLLGGSKPSAIEAKV